MLGAQLAAGLMARGHRVRALAPRGVDAAADAARFDAGHPGVTTTWLPVPVGSGALQQGSRDAAYREAEDAGIRAILPRLIAERRPDVILIGRESAVGEVPPVALRHEIPTVALIQGGITIRAILAGAGDPLARHQLAQLRRVDTVVAIAEHLRDALAPLALRQVRVIRNPVDLERFRPGPKPPALLDRLGISARSVVVSHISNFKRARRTPDIVVSAAQVLAAHPDVVYVLVGDGPDRISAEAQCRAWGLTARVRFTGWVDRDEVPGYLRATDILVMASASEGLPLVYLEAQASGRLLVASDIPATRELVEDGRTGLVFPRGDVVGLAAQTLRAARDPALRAAIGRLARMAVHAHAEPVILDAYARLLEEMVAARGPTGGPGAAGGSERLRWADRLGDDLWALVVAPGRTARGRDAGGDASVASVSPAPRSTFPLPTAATSRAGGRPATTARRAWSAGRPSLIRATSLGCSPGGASPSSRSGSRARQGRTPATLPRSAVRPASSRGRCTGPSCARAEAHAGRIQWRDWRRRLDRDLRALLAAGWLDGATVARAMTVAGAAAPDDADVGLVHGDLCLENIVIREGIIQVVDTEDLRVYACDHDLARTWHRWPMAGPAWHAFREGYETARQTRSFLQHFAHWAIVVLVESAAFRLRAGAAGAEEPLARLRELIARDERPASLLSRAPALPAGRG